ncbi:chemotaxis protein CheA [Halobacillus yeomjeoni]|uniref:Chemotaxis protein CheA n=1 Tax=Halobacillus yeomjeoni TaxID=311194 RepID=A0A931HTU4_9BACI|nr:chemotaxis protein CheA [Halobacillus yeomjeoni]MBH0229293.1 chemotaxis protein CheA [Halobacillus yeomjeoni]
MNQYLDLFIEESKENLQAINDQLLALEKNPQDMTIVNEIFRSAHTLKGMAATMEYHDLADLTHQMENVLDAVRNEKLTIDEEMIDIVFDAVDDLEAMIMDIESGGSGQRNVESVVSVLQAVEKGESVQSEEPSQKASPASKSLSLTIDEYTEAVLNQSEEQGLLNLEVEVELRSDCLLKAARVFMVFEALQQLGEVVQSAPQVERLENEEFENHFIVLLISDADKETVQKEVGKISEIERVNVTEFSVEGIKQVKDEPSQEEIPTPSTKNSEEAMKKGETTSKTIRVPIDRLDRLMNLFEEFVIDRGKLEDLSSTLNDEALKETVEHIGRISSDLQDVVLKMRMVPVEQVFNRFPRMIRQLAKDLEKEVQLTITGAETELDRTVIDEIGDPLVHLIRNALDHGIEKPDRRKAKGKPSAGQIEMKAYHSGNHVFIEISDDGAGISREKVIEKAVGKNVISENEAQTMTDEQVYGLIMESGFSTADELSDVSGRGVGMDVVKSKIQSLGGHIKVESQLDYGSVFTIQLPLTLSILSVMLVRVRSERYGIPISAIVETTRVNEDDVIYTHNTPVIDYRGEIIPLIFLGEVFNIPGNATEKMTYSLLIIKAGDRKAALVVDAFEGQQEVVLKSMGTYLSDPFAISGATILGDGQVALIIDTHALIGE